MSAAVVHAGCMATIEQLQTAERSVRDLLDEQGMPQPDRVEYREASVALLWDETKLAVVIDVDDPAA
jgi:hypothetical protein